MLTNRELNAVRAVDQESRITVCTFMLAAEQLDADCVAEPVGGNAQR
jgi:hypothetical protein